MNTNFQVRLKANKVRLWSGLGKNPGVFIGIIAFWIITGGYITWPTNINWLFSGRTGDPTQTWLGWEFFRQSPWWQWPLGANPAYGMGLENSVVFSDSNPLCALFFKLFSAWLPANFQYFGLWLLACFMLQGYFAQQISKFFTQDRWLNVLSVAFVVCSPVFLYRLAGHYNLMGQWIILAGIYFYFSEKFNAKGWLWLLPIAVLVHFYLFVMVAGLWVADVIQKGGMQKVIIPKKLSKHISVMVLLVLICMWGAGYFMASVAPKDHYFRFGMNLLSLFQSSPNDYMSQSTLGFSSFLPSFPVFLHQQFEGFNYLGLGMIGLFIVSLGLLIKNRATINKLTTAQWYPILGLSLCLFVYSLSNNIAWGETVLYHYKVVYPFTLLTGALRSAGRFFWPVYYLIYFAIFYIVMHCCSRRLAIGLIAGCFIFQVADSMPKWLEIRNQFVNPKEFVNPFDTPDWHKIGQRYNQLIYTRVGYKPRGWVEWGLFANQHNMSVNSGAINRLDPKKVAAENKRLLQIIANNQYNPQSIYLFDNPRLWQYARSKNPAGEFRVFQGMGVFLPE